jgi:hypothetical protein
MPVSQFRADETGDNLFCNDKRLFADFNDTEFRYVNVIVLVGRARVPYRR